MKGNIRTARELVRIARMLVSSGRNGSSIDWRMTSFEEGPYYFGPRKGEEGYDENEVGFFIGFTGTYGKYRIEAQCQYVVDDCGPFNKEGSSAYANVNYVKISRGGTTLVADDLTFGRRSRIRIFDARPIPLRNDAIRKVRDGLSDALSDYRNRIDSGEFESASDIDIVQVLKDLGIYDCKSQRVVRKRDSVWKDGDPVYLRDCGSALDRLSSFLARNGYSSPSDCRVTVRRDVERYEDEDSGSEAYYESERYGSISDQVSVKMNGRSWSW